MCGEEPRIHSYRYIKFGLRDDCFELLLIDYHLLNDREFADNIIPYIKELGYNAVQLMAIQVLHFYPPSISASYKSL